MEKICEICGKPFDAPTKRWKTCIKPECRNALRKRQNEAYVIKRRDERKRLKNSKSVAIGICTVCGDEFPKTRKDRKICSKKTCKNTRYKYMNKEKIPKTCVCCNKDFIPRSHTAKRCPECIAIDKPIPRGKIDMPAKLKTPEEERIAKLVKLGKADKLQGNTCPFLKWSPGDTKDFNIKHWRAGYNVA